ncbi:hypothetical protein [Brenneria izadpanahii]|nr:hypothetical protein [Brenneria izadpanahii]
MANLGAPAFIVIGEMTRLSSVLAFAPERLALTAIPSLMVL